MLENDRIVKARKRNMKLYAFYRAISTDSLFIYAIKLLFLTQVKGIPSSHVIFSLSIFAISIVILQMPVTIVIQKIGYRKSAFLNNVLTIICISILILSTNVVHLCIAELMSAIAFSLKDVAEPSLLNVSIPKTESKGKIYSKIAGRGQSAYYIMDALTAFLAGFLYALNPYLPFILSIIVTILAAITSLLFVEIKDVEIEINENAKTSNKQMQELKQYIQDMKTSFQFIFKSKRLKSLIFYYAITWGFMSIMSEYREAVLKDIGASAQIIGIIYAITSIISSISAKKQTKFHEIFRNHSLSVIIITCSIAMIMSGVIVLLGAPMWVCIAVILVCGMIRSCDNSMNIILIERYLGNFTNEKIISKIYAANSIVKNISRSIITMLASALLAVTTSANAMTIAGIVFFIMAIFIISYMKTRVGLKPEQYEKNEIDMKMSL